MSAAFNAAWGAEQRAVFAQPDPAQRRIAADGRAFVRTLGKRCPHCPSVFFSYQVEDEEQEPYRVDAEPREGRGARETCGHPECHEREDNHQFLRRAAHRAERATHEVQQ